MKLLSFTHLISSSRASNFNIKPLDFQLSHAHFLSISRLILQISNLLTENYSS